MSDRVSILGTSYPLGTAGQVRKAAKALQDAAALQKATGAMRKAHGAPVAPTYRRHDPGQGDALAAAHALTRAVADVDRRLTKLEGVLPKPRAADMAEKNEATAPNDLTQAVADANRLTKLEGVVEKNHAAAGNG